MNALHMYGNNSWFLFTGRFLLLFIANVLNYTILAVGFYSYFIGNTDFGTFLLAILMANAVLHALFYILMKVRSNIM